MHYSNHNHKLYSKQSQVKVAVLAESVQAEEQAQQLRDWLLGGAAIAAAISVYLMLG